MDDEPMNAMYGKEQKWCLYLGCLRQAVAKDEETDEPN